MFQDSLDIAIIVKIPVYMYKDMAGLKINFDKSEVILVMEDSTTSVCK
jgi:hypothetical protein